MVLETYAVTYSYPTTDRYYRGQRSITITLHGGSNMGQIKNELKRHDPQARLVRCRLLDSRIVTR